MSNFVIITDSCVDISENLAKKLELEIVPLRVTVNGKEYTNLLDGSEISSKDFFRMLREKGKTTTTQANPAGFIKVMTKILKSGKDVLSISLSAELSGTYNSSLIAKKELEKDFPGRKIICIDSCSASLGQGLLISYAVDLKNAGKSIDEVADFVETNKTNLSHLITVDDLGHLHRGGRLSTSSMILGSLLKIKPLLHVNPKGGLTVIGKSRGRRKSINDMVSRMINTYDKDKNKRIYITHGDCLEDAEYTKKVIIDRLGVSSDMFTIHPIGPVIGAHTGPNTLGIFYLGNERFIK